MNLSNFYRAILVFAWSVFILTLLLTPMPISEASESVTMSDKIVHALIFGILAFLIFFLLKGLEDVKFLLKNKKSKISKRKLLNNKKQSGIFFLFFYSFAFSLIYSIILEFSQSFIPGRSSNELDLLASFIGIILVLIFVYGDNYYQKA